MFLRYLTERQREALLHYAHEMMRIDNMAAAEELVRLDVLRSEAGPQVEAEDVPLEELGSLFEDRLSRVVLLLEVVGVGYAEKGFSAKESRLANDLADALEIDKDDVLGHIESWVRRQYLMVDEAHRLMRG